MEAIKKYISTVHPLIKIVVAISTAGGLFAGYKMYYRPYAKKQRLLEAEMYAKMLYESENIDENDVQ